MAGATAILVAIAALAAGCVVSPIPQPPPLALDGGSSTVDYCETCDMAGIVVVGAPGSVSVDGEVPSGAVVWGVSLDNTEAPALAEVATDGSFELEIVAFAGHEIRLQARAGERRSEPVDLVAPDEDGALTALPHPLSRCLTTDPELELRLDATGAGEIEIRNDCEAEVAFSPPRLRDEAAPFAVDGGLESLAPAASATLTVRVEGEGIEAEEVLLVEATAPERDLRPITVIAGPAD